MFNKKRWLSLGMVMVLAFAGCGEKEVNSDPTNTPEATKEATPEPTKEATPEPTKEATPEPTKEVTPEPTKAPSYEAGKVIDFEDGNMGFIACKETAPNSAALDMAVVDFAGSKALKVSTEETAKIPYVAIDVSSLAGDAIESVRSIELDLAVSAADGAFYAVSGQTLSYVGADNTEVAGKWSVYLESKNPKRHTITLGEEELFAAGAKNIIILTKETDNAIDKTGSASTLYIDNIVLKDADGNAIALNSAASFNAPDGFGNVDWSNLTPTKPEIKVDGLKYVSVGGWWPNGADGNQYGLTVDPVNAASQSTLTLLDPTAFTSGKFLTATVSIPGGIEDWQKQIQLVVQYQPIEGSALTATSWTAGNSADGRATIEVKDSGEAIFTLQMHLNDSMSMAQVSYDEIAEYLNDPEWFSHVTFMGMRDAGYALTVSDAYIGVEKKVLPATVNDVVLEGYAGLKGSAWSQIGVNSLAWGGTLDPAVFKPGCVITVNYKSAGTVWPVVMSADETYGWTRIAFDEPAEIKSLGLINEENDTVQFTLEQFTSQLGVENLDAIGFLQFESDADFEIVCVSVGEYAAE